MRRAQLASITGLALLMTAVLSAAGGCGDDEEPASYSGFIGISLNLGPSDITNATLADAKNITTESGNPCGEFVRRAEERLGEPAGEIQLDELNIEMGINPREVTNLSDLWSGEITVSMVFDDDTTLALGRVEAPDSDGPVDLTVTVTQAQLDARLTDLLACSYAIQASGPAADGLSNNFDANVEVSLSMAAFK